VLKLFKYIEPLWLGSNGKISIRRVLALAFSTDLIRNISHAIYKWEAGKSYAEVAMLLGLEAGLVAALLALTTYSQNVLKPREDTTNLSD
jgi:hypothetical protein